MVTGTTTQQQVTHEQNNESSFASQTGVQDQVNLPSRDHFPAPLTAMEASSPLGWEPSAIRLELHVPLAETWHYHRCIRNRHGEPMFYILKEERIGRLIQSSSAEPILRMVIGDVAGEVAAVIVRDAKHGMDGYTIYGPISVYARLFEDAIRDPCQKRDISLLGQLYSFCTFQSSPHPGQRHNEPAPYQFWYPHQGTSPGDTDDDIMLDLYPIASVVQSVCGKTYTVLSPDRETIRWRATNGKFRKMLLCCPWCIAVGVCMWEFEFEDLNLQQLHSHSRWQGYHVAPGQSEESSPRDSVVFSRDQDIRFLNVAPGTSPLLALCVAYAVDRLTRPIF